jgi:hypothetical protein
MNAPTSTLAFVKKRIPAEWNFHERLVSLRKERGLSACTSRRSGVTRVANRSRPWMPSASLRLRSA